ncbi:MAG: hypothetical protein ACR2PA_18770 [Hyphomicrobiaceae bacterium]
MHSKIVTGSKVIFNRKPFSEFNWVPLDFLIVHKVPVIETGIYDG